ncbi:hypothetical protein FACS189449_01100 [Alphaproteobacteria bacterium]|nr:hypothetical protein FACS189449_01100 [Alphaproteobacteria bacterium]
MKKLAVLVDGSSFIYRAFFALPQLTTRDGRAIGAVHGFCSMLISLLEKHRSDFFCVALDSGRTTFRSEIFPEYKANRSAVPDELKEQFPLLKEACRAFGVPTVEKVGFEADDLMATYSRKLADAGMEVRIISSDKDLMQLIDENVSMFDPIKSKIIKSEDVFEKYGVYPSQMVHFQALVGDSSDNIPGIKGIGPATATKLLAEYKTLDGIYENIEKIQPPKLGEKLITGKESLALSLKLVTLEKNVGLDDDSLSLSVSYNYDDAVRFLESLGLSNLIKRVVAAHAKMASPPSERYARCICKVMNKSSLQAHLVQLAEGSKAENGSSVTLGFFVSSGLNGNSILAICDGNSVCTCAASTNGGDLFSQTSLLSYEDVCAALKPYFENPNITKISLGGGLKRFPSIDFASYEDMSVMSYLLNGPVGNRLKDIFPNSDDPICALSLENICEQDQICRLAEMIYDNYDDMLHELKKKNLLEVYRKIDAPLVKILKNIEEKGIIISTAKLNQLADIFSEKIKKLEQEIFSAVGYEFKIGSHKQLAEALWGKLNQRDVGSDNNETHVLQASTTKNQHDVGSDNNETHMLQASMTKNQRDVGSNNSETHVLQASTTKTTNIGGGYRRSSLNQEALEEMSAHSPVPELVIEWRSLSKLLSSYTHSLCKLVNPKTGRLHTTFSMTSTSTGRLSSARPNLQNIPARTEIGRLIKSAFISEKGHKLLSFDYSQIELRVLAHIADIKALKEAFAAKKDIHAMTASKIFDVPLDDVTDEMRSHAKTINFAVLYGMSSFGLSKSLGVSKTQANLYIKNYFDRFPEFNKFKEETLAFARKHGYVLTSFGRRCYVKDINSSIFQLKHFDERQAVNAVIQGSASDIVKIAMINISPLLQSIHSSMILQIHDELVFETEDNFVDEAIQVIKDVMENSVDLSVKLYVNVEGGDRLL